MTFLVKKKTDNNEITTGMCTQEADHVSIFFITSLPNTALEEHCDPVETSYEIFFVNCDNGCCTEVDTVHLVNLQLKKGVIRRFENDS